MLTEIKGDEESHSLKAQPPDSVLYANLSRDGASEIGTAVLPGYQRPCFMLLKNGRFFVLYATQKRTIFRTVHHQTQKIAPHHRSCKTHIGMRVASQRQKKY